MAVAALQPRASALVRRPAAKRPPFEIPSLDGLRAVSFLMVFLAHAGFDRVIPGGFGVTVFFFLSGYLITTLLRMEADKSGTVSLKAFYLRRALRILPPFYLVLASAAVLTVVRALPGRLLALPVAAQALHYTNYWIAWHGWDGIASGTGVYWSLAVEEHFYLVFPAVYLVLRRAGLTGRQQAFVLWGACGVVLAWRCILVFAMHAPLDRTYLCSDTRVDSILFGCALAVYNNPMLDETAPPSARDAALWLRRLLPLALVALLSTFVLRGNVFRETLRYSLQGLALVPLFVCAIRWPEAWIFRPLNLRPVRFIGTLTYSLYLLHFVVLSGLEAHTALPRVGRAVVGLVLALALSWTMWIAIERPCARLRKRLSATA
jgi:peptidoglycan/LPS O-acetylase OafA/YrhL